MKIEILYQSCANLYGEATAVAYMRQCLPEAEFVFTELNDVPSFASEKVDLVFMGGMTEDTQELVIEKLLPYKERIAELIDQNVVFLMVSNALEIFGQYIEKEDAVRSMPLDYLIPMLNEIWPCVLIAWLYVRWRALRCWAISRSFLSAMVILTPTAG